MTPHQDNLQLQTSTIYSTPLNESVIKTINNFIANGWSLNIPFMEKTLGGQRFNKSRIRLLSKSSLQLPDLAGSNDHTVQGMSKQASHMSKTGLETKLNSKSFFNPKWSDEEVIKGVEEAYAAGLKKGVLNSEFNYIYKGESITVFINKDGMLSSAYGGI